MTEFLIRTVARYPLRRLARPSAVLVFTLALAYGGLWCVVAAIFRYSSLAGLIACLATPLVLFWLGNPAAAILFVLLTALVWFKHRANIARLLSGTEPKIGASK